MLPKKSRDGASWLNGPYLAEAIEKFPQIPLEKGIHLHWALPDVITQGTVSETQDLAFPAAPNRWLVTRIYTSYKNPEKPINHIQSWVVESDYVMLNSSENFPTTFPCDTESQFHLFLGKVYSLMDWIKRDQTDRNYLKIQTGKDLTSIGYGNVNFSSYYPNCRNVFGFYDSLIESFEIPDFDPGSNQISYVINGWYENPEDDILNLYASRPEDLKWKFNEDYPARTICSGTAQNVIWDNNKDYNEIDQQSDLKVTIGNNDIECLSALFASDQGKHSNAVEYQLNALQLGILNKLAGESDLPAKLEEELHTKAFDVAKGGNIWEVVKKAKTETSLHSESATEVSLSEIAASLLNELNLLQYEYDKARNQLESLRESLYMDWYRSMLLQYLPDKSGAKSALSEEDTNDLLSNLQDYIATSQDSLLTNFVKEIGNYQYDPKTFICSTTSDPASLAQRIVNKWKALDQELAKGSMEYRIQLSNSPSYFRPKDPVILLSGDAASPSIRYGYDHTFDESGKLPCRKRNELLQHLTHKNTSLMFNIDDLSLEDTYEQLPLWDDIALILTEAFIADLNQSTFIAFCLYKKSETNSSVSFSELAKALQDFQTNLLRQNSIESSEFAVQGILPIMPLAINIWQSNPSSPLFLYWEVEYHPVQRLISGDHTSYAKDLISGNFLLDQFNVDFNARNDIPLGDYQKYSGTVMLTPHGFIDLKAALTQYLQESNDEELSELLKNAHFAPLLSQSLGGFHDALIMQHESIQMQVKDPQEPLPVYQNFVNSVAENVNNYLSTNPLPQNDFNPIRGGFANVSTLKLIDIFGKERILPTDPDHLIKSENLTVNTGNPNVDRLIYLPPRLSQHARLLFRWISANNDRIESNDHPASSPICGWVIPDLLYEGLFFYDYDGSPLGIINLINDRSVTRWTSFPQEGKNVLPLGSIADQINDIKKSVKNVHLLNFILSVFPIDDKESSLSRSAHFLDQLFNSINKSAGTIIPANTNEENNLALLMGRPLALVRASLDLELKGLPAHELSWATLQEETQNDPKQIRNTRGFTEVKFPVHLGDLTQVTDGLVGFFKGTENNTDYGTFFSPAAQDHQDIVKQPNDSTIMLTSDPLAATSYLTLLIDPRVNIHVTTGILPVGSISVPPDQFETALRKLQLAFPVHPILSAKFSVAIYKPLIPGYTWKWMFAKEGTWKSEPEIIKPSTVAEMGYTPQSVKEGWLILTPDSE
ncbi:hypothetical protein [Leptospira hartskeerlii]|nr:hypothetical protein [Leptospira hartskeerlii]